MKFDGSTVEYINGLGTDEKLRQSDNTGTFYFTADYLGSTTALTDASGNVVERLTYDSFGDSIGSNRTRYDYTGRERDKTTNLIYYRARWYDPQTGRFLSEDPIGFAGGDINLYGYVWNNPLSFTDPMGLDGWGNDTADWLDDKVDYARGFYQSDVQDWVWNGSVDTIADLSSGAADMLRVGSGIGHAIYDEDDNGYGRAANVARDVARAAGLFTLFGSPAAKFNSTCTVRTANPFKGKTPQQIENMFMKKGFQAKGSNPLNGDGTYVNPKSGRGYHIDAHHPPPKPPHVGVHRPRALRKKMASKDFEL